MSAKSNQFSRSSNLTFVFVLFFAISLSAYVQASGQTTAEDASKIIPITVSITGPNVTTSGTFRMSDFRVFEDGLEKEVSGYTEVETASTTMLLIDCSSSMLSRQKQLAMAVDRFMQHLRPIDQIMAVAFDGRDFHEILPRQRVGSIPPDLNLLIGGARVANDNVHDAVKFAVSRMQDVSGKKSIVLFTSGIDIDQKSANRSLLAAQAQDTTVYTVRIGKFVSDYNGSPSMQTNPKFQRSYGSPGGSEMDTQSISQGLYLLSYPDKKKTEKFDADTNFFVANYLKSLAQQTGGRSFDIDDKTSQETIDQEFSRIASELTQQYTLSYYSDKPGRDGEHRKIEVVSIKPGVTVRSRPEVVYRRSIK